MEAPPITVLVPTHARPQLLKRTLTSLTRCAIPETYRELIVVENGSRDGAEAIIDSLPDRLNTRYIHRHRGNKSRALNEALATIRDGLVVFFDDDVRMSANVLLAYAEAARGIHRGVFFGGPTGVDYEQPPPAGWLMDYLPPSAKGWRLDEEVIKSKFEHFLGFNWAAFAKDLRSLNGFNEQFGPGTPCTGQETDMQQRLRAAGVKQLFVRGATVWHYVPNARCTPLWTLHRHYRNGMTEGALRHYSALRSWVFPNGR